MTSPPLVNPISFSSAQLITRSFGSSLPARVFYAPIPSFWKKGGTDGIFFLFLQKENVCAPILFFLFFEKEKNRRAR